MAQFVCTRCGKCCMNFGRYIRIATRVGETLFSCRSTLRNEVFEARLMQEHRNAFRAYPRGTGSAAWCPFLREEEGGKRFLCTIYDSRPQFCREFRCLTMRVYGPDGEIIGKVGGGRSLTSGDPALRALWAAAGKPGPEESEQDWQARVSRSLAEHGYRVEILE